MSEASTTDEAVTTDQFISESGTAYSKLQIFNQLRLFLETAGNPRLLPRVQIQGQPLRDLAPQLLTTVADNLHIMTAPSNPYGKALTGESFGGNANFWTHVDAAGKPTDYHCAGVNGCIDNLGKIIYFGNGQNQKGITYAEIQERTKAHEWQEFTLTVPLSPVSGNQIVSIYTDDRESLARAVLETTVRSFNRLQAKKHQIEFINPK